MELMGQNFQLDVIPLLSYTASMLKSLKHTPRIRPGPALDFPKKGLVGRRLQTMAVPDQLSALPSVGVSQ